MLNRNSFTEKKNFLKCTYVTVTVTYKKKLILVKIVIFSECKQKQKTQNNSIFVTKT